MTAPSAPRGERLQLSAFEFDSLPDGHCAAEVVLSWPEGDAFRGRAQGLGSDAGQLRCAAEAALGALKQAVEGRVAFDLLGVKGVRAFDSVVVLVSLSAHIDDASHRLVGSYLTEQPSPRGAALAVLHATNRLLGNIFLRDVN